MSDHTEAPYKPPLSAILFDLRSVIGLLFVVYGIVLTIVGIIGETPEQIAKSGGLALNLWTGVVMLVVGIIFYIWARRETNQRVFHPVEAALATALVAVAILAVYETWTGAVSPL